MERSPLLYKYTYLEMILSFLYIPLSVDQGVFMVFFEM